MNIPKLVLACLLATIPIMGCHPNPNGGSSVSDSNISRSSDTVTANVIFRAFSIADQQPLSDVNIIIVDQSGRIVSKLATNDAGEVNQDITVPVDPKYRMERGTVMVIACKQGYRDVVMFETPVSGGSAAQPFYMEPITPDERNEPVVQLGNNHRLEILSLVEKYKEDAYANPQ